MDEGNEFGVDDARYVLYIAGIPRYVSGMVMSRERTGEKKGEISIQRVT